MDGLRGLFNEMENKLLNMEFKNMMKKNTVDNDNNTYGGDQLNHEEDFHEQFFDY
jgi:hypothetical protein